MAAFESATSTRKRFDSAEKAARYPTGFGSGHHGRCERRALERALEAVPRGGTVLDLPCGTGRLIGMLLARDCVVTCADSSPAMIERARGLWAGHEASPSFEVQDVFATTYPDDSFDAVVCVRLFHHFVEESTRRAALAELGRVSRGPIVVSFFNLASPCAWWRRLRHALRGRRVTDRVAISARAFARDCEAVGLRLDRLVRAHRVLYQQTYAVISRQRPRAAAGAAG
jgi:ubiquinone/menaquinone biosynthesis C-methylase UbiE